jgi:hypothetical protein
MQVKVFTDDAVKEEARVYYRKPVFVLCFTDVNNRDQGSLEFFIVFLNFELRKFVGF